MSQAIASARASRAQTNFRETLDLREVVHLFRDHLGKIFLCVALGVILALLYLRHASPTYTSSAMLEVTQRSNEGPAPTEIETSELLKTVELKLASQAVLLAVIKANNLAADPEFLNPPPGIFSPESVPMQWLSERLASIGLPNILPAAKERSDATPVV